eukprot:CAMPEP_0184675328 /NCGR_PEP_ID=MMETSP0308-20130426/87729_1 /TAXON_ID=38269 /ORGANISM="Gloeochaete witrockiana, Strain SAG 46.84" /LENGTH=492 /DNA_ID=CAMNT_0027123025 /DNA_START=348 /DNA_END=1826 /DNA_ORIENTATION=-
MHVGSSLEEPGSVSQDSVALVEESCHRGADDLVSASLDQKAENISAPLLGPPQLAVLNWTTFEAVPFPPFVATFAYLDLRPRRMLDENSRKPRFIQASRVVMIAAMPARDELFFGNPLICRLMTEEGKIIDLLATVIPLGTPREANKRRTYASEGSEGQDRYIDHARVLCDIPFSKVPKEPMRVALLTSKESKVSFKDAIPVTLLKPKAPDYKFGVIVISCYGRRASRMVEFIEYYRSQGAEHFTVHPDVRYLGRELSRVLEYYSAQGILDVVPVIPFSHTRSDATQWRFRRAGTSALTCYYVENAWLRSIYKYKYTAVVDFDEFLVSYENRTILSQVDELFERNPHTASLEFQSHIFPTNCRFRDALLETASHRFRQHPEWHVRPHERKGVHRLDMVDSLLLHGMTAPLVPVHPKTFERQTKHLDKALLHVPPALMSYNHYRNIEKWGCASGGQFSCCNTESLVMDETIIALTNTDLETRVQAVHVDLGWA